ncbi:MAG: hypothetical protein GC171_07775 [Terrimonas sp.]|nr:hypothetical protein [Terrimonas sp.]
MLEPKFLGLSDFRVTSLAGDQSIMELNINYYNPNTYGVKMKKTEFDVFIDNELAGHAAMDTVLRINPLQNFTIPIQLKARTKDILKHSLALLINKKLMIKITGTTRIGKAGIYFNYPIYYEGMQSIQMD